MKLRTAPSAALLLALCLAAPAVAEWAIVAPPAAGQADASQPPAKPWDRPILYGVDLLSKVERRRYRADIKALETDEEKRAHWEAHIEQIQRLALERGVSIDLPPNRPRYQHEKRRFGHAPYFLHLMTGEERYVYRDTIWYIQDDAERKIFVSAHIFKMQARARERGVSFPILDRYEREAVEAVGATVDPWNGAATLVESSDARASGEAGSKPLGDEVSAAGASTAEPEPDEAVTE